MKTLEDFLRPTQETLFRQLRKMFGEKAVAKKDSFLLVPGEVPVLLVAHLDTVHREPVKVICQSEKGNILMSPQGIGGDDRCGVYGIAKVYEATEKKPWLLFTCDEETGGYGADVFCDAYLKKKLPKELKDLKMMIELDRKGKNDAVYYDCDNPAFEEYIKSKGFMTECGTFSDISTLAPVLGVAAVNLSCGYYHAHTIHEYINRKQLKAVIKKVAEMVSDAAEEDFPKYEYIEAEWDDSYGYEWNSALGIWETARSPKNLPESCKGIYEELMDVYPPSDLEAYRRAYGDGILRELYIHAFGAG